MPKVHLSKFVCGELVYDYLTGKLEPARREKFLSFLKEDNELRKKLDRQKNALRYLGELKKLELSEEYLLHIRNTHKLDVGNVPMPDIIESPKNEQNSVKEIVKSEEPEGGFWERNREFVKIARRSSEAIGLALVVFVVIKLLPPEYFEKGYWFSNSDLIFQDEEFTVGQKTKSETEVDFSEVNEDEEAGEPGTNARQVEAKSEGSTNKVDAKSLAQKEDQAKDLKPNDKKPAVSLEKAVKVSEENVSSGEVQYYLYRSVVYVDNFETVAQDFLSLIESKGAEKAGKVKLGWEKPNARYFHFHILESEKQKVVDFFKRQTNFKLNRIDHWRKTPEDKIRVIVEIRQQGQ